MTTPGEEATSEPGHAIDERPCLRPVDAFPVEHEGRRFLALRDPAGYTASVLMLPIELVDIVARFDGQHGIVDIQAGVMRRTGEMVFRQTIEEMIATLDEHGFMDGPRFAERRASIDGAFLGARSRPAAHAGGAYPATADELRAAMDRFFEAPAGPGPIEWAASAREIEERPGFPGALPSEGECEGPFRGPSPCQQAMSGPPISGIIAPHIDFHRGGPAYAWAYREVAERCPADLFVIFGTCHAGMRDPFALTRKDYETPLGPAAVDQPFVDALATRAGLDCFASEIAHRTEHSIEFQAVFLRYLWHGRRDFTIVPVLTSFAHEALSRGQRPDADARVQRFLDAIAETAESTGRRVAYVAGADLAHVGPRFGDPAPISAEALARVGREDRDMLRAVEDGDAGGFFASVAADGDRRRICGLSPIYALLHVLGKRRGALRHYGQWPDPEAVVTYASVVF